MANSGRRRVSKKVLTSAHKVNSDPATAPYDTAVRAIVIGDTHWPWASKRWYQWMLGEIRSRQPDHIIQIGDLYDNYFLSRHPKHLSILTPQDEVDQGDTCAKDMWAKIKAVAPKAECIQIRGNHDDRDIKKILNSAPELEPLLDMRSRFEFKGVRTVHDSFEEFWLKDICIQHGYRKGGEHARYNQAPTVVGHSHRGGVQYFQNRRGVYWELNAGFGGDPTAACFRYRNQRDIHMWTNGLGLIDETGPHFLLMPGQ
jgi:predicted phosphodiesterase